MFFQKKKYTSKIYKVRIMTKESAKNTAVFVFIEKKYIVRNNHTLVFESLQF